MTTSDSPRRPFSLRAQIALLLLLLAGIAVLMSMGRTSAEVTVSGLTLLSTREQVVKAMGQPNFQDGSSGQLTHLEYWSDPVNLDPSLSLEFNPDGTMTRMRGGRPQIDGENVRGWTLSQVERALGPAAFASHASSLSSGGSVVGGDAFLKYPDRHLLVTWNPESGIDFILFAGMR